jgi:hypothetical protein
MDAALYLYEGDYAMAAAMEPNPGTIEAMPSRVWGSDAISVAMLMMSPRPISWPMAPRVLSVPLMLARRSRASYQHPLRHQSRGLQVAYRRARTPKANGRPEADAPPLPSSQRHRRWTD